MNEGSQGGRKATHPVEALSASGEVIRWQFEAVRWKESKDFDQWKRRLNA